MAQVHILSVAGGFLSQVTFRACRILYNSNHTAKFRDSELQVVLDLRVRLSGAGPGGGGRVRGSEGPGSTPS